MRSNTPFRAIVVGGGPVGLVAAHCFERAGIDFVVLERQPAILADLGASLVINPSTMRVFAQLGILDEFLALSHGLDHFKHWTVDGRLMKQSKLFDVVKANHGSPPRCCHRADLIKLIYDALPGSVKDQVLVDKNVIGVEASADGVIAHCADGTSHEGSIIVGADGIGSRARRAMNSIDTSSKEPFTAEYRCLWFSLPRQPHVQDGSAYETHGAGFVAQLLQTHRKAWVFLYERLEASVSRGDATKYTDADITDMIKRWGHVHMDAETTAKQMYDQRYKAGMTNVDEGTVQRWSSGRTVLVGDSAHKMTPNFAQGFNNGVQDVVALTNELGRLLGYAEEGGGEMMEKGEVITEHPTADALRTAFERYETTRLEPCKHDVSISSLALRGSAWANLFYQLLDRVILPALPDRLNRWLFTRMTAASYGQGVVLDCVACEEPFTGSIPWANAMRREQE